MYYKEPDTEILACKQYGKMQYYNISIADFIVLMKLLYGESKITYLREQEVLYEKGGLFYVEDDSNLPIGRTIFPLDYVEEEIILQLNRFKPLYYEHSIIGYVHGKDSKLSIHDNVIRFTIDCKFRFVIQIKKDIDSKFDLCINGAQNTHYLCDAVDDILFFITDLIIGKL